MMDWIDRFDLFLFDFDGLLVNTEELHFAAYQELCRRHGVALDWTLNYFFSKAHFTADGLKEALLPLFPSGSDWDVLYREKKAIYQELIGKGALTLMPGVEPLLVALKEADKRRCVVTHSPRASIDLIKSKIELLQSIPHWFTRESYSQPKPHPDGYLTAIRQLGKPGDVIVGFEDSVRGLSALQAAGVTNALLICPPDHPQLIGAHHTHFSRIDEIDSALT